MEYKESVLFRMGRVVACLYGCVHIIKINQEKMGNWGRNGAVFSPPATPVSLLWILHVRWVSFLATCKVTWRAFKKYWCPGLIPDQLKQSLWWFGGLHGRLSCAAMAGISSACVVAPTHCQGLGPCQRPVSASLAHPQTSAPNRSSSTITFFPLDPPRD